MASGTDDSTDPDRAHPLDVSVYSATALRDPVPLADNPSDKTPNFAREALREQLFGRRRGPRKIGRYDIGNQLGAGGMGVVLKAHDPTLARTVAIKLIRGTAGKDLSARLLREARAMATLTHPNVVQVYEAGEHDGQVFIAMEFVEGVDLREWIRRQRASGRVGWREVLNLFLQAGRGLVAAHAVGLTHRDFKPENVFVGNDGRVRVGDFGLARRGSDPPAADSNDLRNASGASSTDGSLAQTVASQRVGTDHPSTLSAELTAAGTIVGTPAYMAPEQFLGLAADERTDEFALAVSLWEALYGQRPFAGDTLASLSVAVTSGTRKPAPSDSSVPTWLRHMLERALSVERHQRFESVRVMLDAIETQLRWARTRLLVAGLSLGLLAVAALGIVAAVQWQRAATNEARALASEAGLQQTVRELEDEKLVNQRTLSVQRGLRAKMLIPDDSEEEALKLGVLAVGTYGPNWDRPAPPEAIDALEHVLADDAVIIRPARTLEGHHEIIWGLVYAPDGSTFATASDDHTARIWDANSGRIVATLRGHDDMVRVLAYSPDGTRIATASHDHTARVWDANSGELLATLRGHENYALALDYSPDGTRIATSGYDDTLRIWDAHSGDLLTTIQCGDSLALAYSPDGSRIATGCADQTVIWDATSGKRLATLRGHEREIWALAFSPDGAHLATASPDKTARVWDVRKGTLVATLRGHSDYIRTLAYSPDGSNIATASGDETARIWDAHSGDLIATLQGHEREVWALAYSPDGSKLASASGDKTTRIWDAQSGHLLATLRGHEHFVAALAYSPDGTRIATVSGDKTVRVWDVPPENQLTTVRGHQQPVFALAFSPDGSSLATASADKTARIWDADSGHLLATLRGHDIVVRRLAYAPDGSLLATQGGDNEVRVWDVFSGDLLATLRGHEHWIQALSFSPDGTKITTGSLDHTARIWDAYTGDLLATLHHEFGVRALVFSPDGTSIATGCDDATVRIWDSIYGDLLTTLRGHESAVWEVVYSPDGSRIATASKDKTARIWNAASGHLLHTLGGHEDELAALAYSPDGSRIATASLHTVRLWNAQSGHLLATLQGHQEYVEALAFSPDGTRLATASNDDTAKVWDTTSYTLVSTLLVHDRDIHDITFSPDGTTIATASSDFTAKIWNPETGEVVMDFKNRIGLRQSDGTVQWPISPRELTRIGCQRLQTFDQNDQETTDICDRLVGE